ncbi:MAG: type II toxin-antitoxin system RelE/ParE family toxin [Bacteroidetes bacterium]|nr:type II toxin-antitoxin system RelE/ParE family toxin [Bacteroidota bacterium]MCH8031029.1 type II toxin-antitoxin system RelE/ParE family toxin [Bacteroidota bacterium]
MILKIKHKGLRTFWDKGDTRKINPDWQRRIDRIMNALDLAQTHADMDFPGWRLHPLKGEYRGFYAVDVSGNWRIVFRFDGNNTTDVDLIDYH